jgi:hypothetical protein
MMNTKLSRLTIPQTLFQIVSSNSTASHPSPSLEAHDASTFVEHGAWQHNSRTRIWTTHTIPLEQSSDAIDQKHAEAKFYGTVWRIGSPRFE